MAHDTDYTHIYVDTSVSPNVGLSIYEIASALGRSGVSDLGLLCADKKVQGGSVIDAGKLNLMSRRKPTQWAGFESPDPAQPKGSSSTDIGYHIGTKAYGVQKTYFEVSDTQYHPGDRQASINGDLGYFNMSLYELLSSKWSAVQLSKYRDLDFDDYISQSCLSYPSCGGSVPYIVFNEMIQGVGNTVEFQAAIRYDYDNVYLAGFPRAGLLGLRSLFGLDAFSPDTPAYMGLVLYSEVASHQSSGRLDRTTPLVALAIKTATQLGTTDSSEPYSTGASDMIFTLRTIDATHTSNSASDQGTCFLWGESVKVFPVIARRNNSDNGWILFTLAYKSIPLFANKVITSGGTPTTDTLSVTGGTLTYKIVKQSDGSFVFYLESDASFQLTTSGSMQRIYFGASGTYPYSAGPGDGNSTVVKIGSEIMGTTYDSITFQRYYSARSAGTGIVLQTSNLIYGYDSSASYLTRKGTFILKPYAGVSSFTIAVRIVYLYMADGQYVEKYLSGTATVSTSASTGDTVQITLQ